MAIIYQHQFHHVALIQVRPTRVIGTGSEAFAVCDILLHPRDGEPVLIEIYADRGVFELPVVRPEE